MNKLVEKWIDKETLHLSSDVRKIDYSSIELDGIDYRDYPDFCDAYISSCCYDDGTYLNEDAINELNEDSSLIHEKVLDLLF